VKEVENVQRLFQQMAERPTSLNVSSYCASSVAGFNAFVVSIRTWLWYPDTSLLLLVSHVLVGFEPHSRGRTSGRVGIISIFTRGLTVESPNVQFVRRVHACVRVLRRSHGPTVHV
jgi:hypothetical protein